HITIEGSTDLAFCERVGDRFRAYGWHVLQIADGNDLAEIDRVIDEARTDGEHPTLVVIRTHIAYGSPNKQDTAAAHGAPLGEEEVEATKRNLGWPYEEPFTVPDEARIVIEGKKAGKLTDLIEGTVARLRLSVDKSTVLEVHAEGPRYRGKVKAIDPDRQMITLTIGGKDGVGGKDKDFKLTKSTVVVKQVFNTRLKLKDIQIGDHVVLRLSIDQKAAASLIVLSE
ncbi:MAG: hypothetical protein IH831_09860, partial [Planctomycetes bacterium]|nr:hypothetical protein [Planctomycetota bacterium]